MAKSQKKIETETPFTSYQIKLDGQKFTYRTRRDRPIAVLVGITQSGATHVWRWTSSPKLVKRGMSFLKRSPEFTDAFIVEEIVELDPAKAAVSLPQGSHKQTRVLVSNEEFEAARAKKAPAKKETKKVAVAARQVFRTKKLAIDARPEGVSRKQAAELLEATEEGYVYSA